MIIDTHCHLNFKAFADDLPEIVRRAKSVGVGKLIVPGADLESSFRAVELSRQYPEIYAAVGIHPHHVLKPHFSVTDSLRQLTNMLEKGGVGQSQKMLSGIKVPVGKIVAIGEIGLDFYEYKKTIYEKRIITPEIKKLQVQLLSAQLLIAHKYGLPVILHCRQAFPELIQTISNNSRTDSPPDNYINTYHQPVKTRSGVIHCFTGSRADLEALLAIGLYIGFDGNITYSSDYSPLVAATPLNRLLLETDAPYLAPLPFRGQRNEPANIQYTAETVAKYCSASLSEVIHLSTKNAMDLFNLKNPA